MPRPTGITLDRKNKKLIIAWDDAQTCEYPLELLREACPCVECRGGHANMGGRPDVNDLLTTIPLARAKSYAVERLVPVGHYALQPEWTDGHKTGIYTWAYLRDLCQDLSEALKKRDEDHRPLGQ
jgi:DUF971 family protein